MRTPVMLLLAATSAFTFSVSVGHAAPVEYVRICPSGFPSGNFFYVPGTDTCFDVLTGETRTATAGGPLVQTLPNAPAAFVPSAAAACADGHLQTLGSVQAADLVLNTRDRYETPAFAHSPAPGEFISKLILSGGIAAETYASGYVRFTGLDTTVIPGGTQLARGNGINYLTTSSVTIGPSGTADVLANADIVTGLSGTMPVGTTLSLATAASGIDDLVTVISGFDSTTAYTNARTDFCFAFRDGAGNEAQLGCANAGSLRQQLPALAFTPNYASPPPGVSGPVSIVAVARQTNVPSTLTGELQIAACVKNTSDDGAACKTSTGADGVTVSCGTSSATLAHGRDGAAGSNGTNGSSCSVADNGDGTATLSCPDGTSTLLATPTTSPKAKGCNGLPGASALLVALAIALRRRKARHA